MLSLAVIKQSVVMALQNIKSNKMRSFLTMLGIMIGVAAVIGLITIVQIVSDNVMNQFSTLGAGTLNIMTWSTPLKDGLTEGDLRSISNIEGVDGVSPTVSFTTTSVVDNEVYEKTDIAGKSFIYFERNKDITAYGRSFVESDMSGDSYVCIVDPVYVKKVLRGKDIIGRKILVGGYTYTIIGIRKKDESINSYMSDNSQKDGTIIIPYKNALAMSGKNNVENAEVYISSDAKISEVESALRKALNRIYNGDDDFYAVINMDSLMEMMDKVYGLLGTMLGGIASIALVVGGIGIMNMMLTSVSERTKEIGLRKALGAEPSRIQAQFLIESVVLSGVGGVIGIFIGLIIALVAASLMKAQFTVSFGAIALGFGFSAAVGIIFGWMPAKRASNLNPIDALRSE